MHCGRSQAVVIRNSPDVRMYVSALAWCQFHPLNTALASMWLLTSPSSPLQFGCPVEPEASPWKILMTLPGPDVLFGLSAVATGDGRPNALPIQPKGLPS